MDDFELVELNEDGRKIRRRRLGLDSVHERTLELQ